MKPVYATRFCAALLVGAGAFAQNKTPAPGVMPGDGEDKNVLTDDTGAEAVDCVHHVRDLHVTLLRLLGLDDNRLTYFHGGRFKQLSQFGGQAIKELIA